MAARRCTEGLPRVLLAAALALAAADGRGYEDGAPPGYTGGFGEPDCSACHSDFDRNAPAGELAIEGLPAGYTPGKRYALALVLQHPELASGGFQLAVRTADGEPAGELAVASVRLELVTEAGQPYLQHTREGTETEREGSIRWEFEWRAPETAEPLVVHAAANAANDDFSAFGDFIYTLEQALRPVGARLTGDAASGAAVARETGSYRLVATPRGDQDAATGSSRNR